MLLLLLLPRLLLHLHELVVLLHGHLPHLLLLLLLSLLLLASGPFAGGSICFR